MGRKQTKSGKIRLTEVAKLAGVSPITASRFFRNPEALSLSKRERVDSAVKELGYVPNLAARALASHRTEVIGVVIPSLTNNVFADVLRGVYDSSEGSRYSIQLANTRYSILQEEKLLRLFRAQKPAGLIVTGINQTAESRAILESMNCPVTQIMEIGDSPVDMMVGFSHYDAAFAAISHILEQGYRRIGFLGARMDPRVQRRFEGYRDAMKAASLFDPNLVVTTSVPTTVTLGGTLFADLLAQDARHRRGLLRQRRPRARRPVRMPAPADVGSPRSGHCRLQRSGIHGFCGPLAHQRAHQSLRNGPARRHDGDRRDRGPPPAGAGSQPWFSVDGPRELDAAKHLIAVCGMDRAWTENGSAIFWAELGSDCSDGRRQARCSG